jgi:hypothetical protein
MGGSGGGFGGTMGMSLPGAMPAIATDTPADRIRLGLKPTPLALERQKALDQQRALQREADEFLRVIMSGWAQSSEAPTVRALSPQEAEKWDRFIAQQKNEREERIARIATLEDLRAMSTGLTAEIDWGAIELHDSILRQKQDEAWAKLSDDEKLYAMLFELAVTIALAIGTELAMGSLGEVGTARASSGLGELGSREIRNPSPSGGTAGFDAAGQMPRYGSRPIQPQFATNTCGPTSVGMVLDTLIPERASTNIIDLQLSSHGTHMDRLGALLKANGTKAALKSGATINDIATATAGGKPVIAHVHMPDGGGHFLVVDGVTTRMGERVLAIRDPLKGRQYFELVSEFSKSNRFSGWIISIP